MLDLPCRLDRALDDIGVGAMLRNLEDDVRAIIIDWRLPGGIPIAVRVTEKARRMDKLPSRPGHYEVFIIRDFKEWIVLTPGHDELFIE